MQEVKDDTFYQEMETYILANLQKNSDKISDENLLEILLTFCMTRRGSRELHKTIEYIVNIRVERIGKENAELLGKFYVLYTNSGLVSPDTLRKIEIYL